MIRHIVFDMGNVLTEYEPVQFARHYTHNEQECTQLVETVFRSPEWQLLDLGRITYPEAAVVWQTRSPALSEAIGQIADHWHEQKQLILPTNRLALALNQNGYKTFLLSNCSDKFPLYRDSIPGMRGMSGFVLSYECHVLKPDPALFHALFDAHHLSPETCFFIDDIAANIEVGRTLGMDGFVFPKDVPAEVAVARLVERLQAVGVRISMQAVQEVAL